MDLLKHLKRWINSSIPLNNIKWMQIYLHKKFYKDYAKLTTRIQKKFKEKRDLFFHDEFNAALNNHALKGKWLGYRSINVTGDIRAIFKRGPETVIFVAIDSHSNLYG